MLNGSALRRDRMRRAPKLTAMLSVVVSITMPVTARAQTPSPLAEWQYSVGLPLEKLFDAPIPQWQTRLGLAVTVRPRYDGAANYHALVGPAIDVRYRDLFFLSTGEGLGVNLVSTTHWRAGLAITYDLGRRAEDNSGHLDGMGNINPAPEAKLFAEYAVSKTFPLVIRADIRRNLGGSDGWIGDLGAYMPLPGSSEKFFWFAGPNLVFADSRYMQTWYGVSSLQSARSGYPRYDASAGLKSVGFGVSAIWFFQKHWFVTGDAGIQQLVGDAARSPITQKASNAVFDFSFNYQF
ncbi:MipA/OmpV family protein [Paraburkholderia sp. GAS334]|uniref:MipA/OmpV family protein n=1 Tax=Paraburkholderia sp. GAS334 TaxID=3035131 RepID=UPI003D211763